ncbi:G-protein coupled receptor 182-like [Electrophorus electricus]|uniref:G-protein coupled receptors family 1 profile domain-containing protein n=1 Tax=Electrophorus electricus TaxID=8005 RepID=A0A4W4G820_ELEEL|nr:G-protein coupled receptor 182-like [Electrophorus electricus]XP_026857828.2 G-protein coupled receptor 182-like [Electrophorus electricus]XP_026857829.2 G-protein coupled receptor 182-like [Electrophorus electricus]XP_026857830.2 G-protein coupled receptor 182-like [Electrophorus electricus]
MDYHDNETTLSYCHIEFDYTGRRISLFLFHLFVFIMGLTMNVTVVWVNWQRRHSHNTVFFCLLNMGLADTMIMVMLPVQMLEVIMDHVWVWGNFLCRFSNLVIVANIYASSLFLAYMSAERYLVLARGSMSRVGVIPEKRKRGTICAALWVLALFFSSLETVHVRTQEWTEPGCYLMPKHAYEEWFSTIIIIRFMVQFAMPAATIVASNVLAARAVRASPEVQARKTGDVLLLHLYYLVFVVCWLPYQITMLLILENILNPDLLNCIALQHLLFSYTVVRTITFLHCLANPILYSFLSRSFRGKLINLILHHLPQDAVSKQVMDQHGNPQGDATANRTKGSNGGGNSTSQSE